MEGLTSKLSPRKANLSHKIEFVVFRFYTTFSFV